MKDKLEKLFKSLKKARFLLFGIGLCIVGIISMIVDTAIWKMFSWTFIIGSVIIAYNIFNFLSVKNIKNNSVIEDEIQT